LEEAVRVFEEFEFQGIHPLFSFVSGLWIKIIIEDVSNKKSRENELPGSLS